MWIDRKLKALKQGEKCYHVSIKQIYCTIVRMLVV